MHLTRATCIILGLLCRIALAAQTSPQQFIFFSRDRERIHEASFYNHAGISGAQITYSWRNLESSKGVYDFSMIGEDLAFLTSHHKKLFIQLQDLTFSSKNIAVPDYIVKDSGVVHSIYSGWIPKRWDKKVADRLHALLSALGKEFDGRIEGINLQETSIDINEATPGFTTEGYVQALKETMRVMRSVFPKSVTVMYANFMPGDSKKDLAELYQYAREIYCGMGGPDIKVHRPAQMNNSYPMLREISAYVPVAMAVQEGNYSVENPKTKKQVTLDEIIDFATNYLSVSYIFWCMEEPWYSKEVLPMLQHCADSLNRSATK
jgi:hypothetical protein